MPITVTTPWNIGTGSTMPDLETLINALRGNIIASVAESDGLTTYTLVNATTITYQHAKQKSGILTGMAITRASALNYSIGIGSYQGYGNVRTHAAPTALSLGAPDATNPRFDLIVGNASGVLSVVAGTPSSTPAYPSVGANETILHVVGVPSSASAYNDSVLVSQLVETATIPSIQVNAQGQVSFGGAIIKPRVVTYTADGAVDIKTTVHAVDTSTGGAPIALDMPSYAEATDLEGITFSFFDTGNAATDNWTVEVAGGGGTIATATTNNQVIRITIIGGLYIVG